MKLLDARNAPAMLTASRAVLGPVVLVEAQMRVEGVLVIVTLFLALLSDVFDGVIARRLKVVTAALRVADSRVDTFYHLCVLTAI